MGSVNGIGADVDTIRTMEEPPTSSILPDPAPAPLPHRLRITALRALVAAVALGALSTFGDWLWTHYIPDGAVVPGVLHGVVIFLALAAVLALGTEPGRRRTAARDLLLTLPVLGALIAAAFYPIAMATGYLVGLLVTWVAMWLGTAALQRQALGGVEGLGRALARGALAAAGSGLAFWAISGIWTSPSPDGPDYLHHFLSWTFAFLPGFLALLLLQPTAGPDAEP